MKKAFVLILIILLMGCETKVQKTEDQLFININIRNHGIFENMGIYVHDFIISPIHSNSFWILNPNGPSYELNLRDSSWTNLDKIFGVNSNELKLRDLHRDPLEQNLTWISNRRHGLILYNHENDSLFTFDSLKEIHSISFLEKNIIIGTQQGLFIIDRNQKEVPNKKKFPETNIKEITLMKDPILLINNKYEYNSHTDKIIRIREADTNLYFQQRVNDILISIYTNKLITIEKEKHKNEFSVPGSAIENIIVDDEMIWIPKQNLNENLVKYDFIKNQTDSINIGYNYKNYKSFCDNDYLWFYNDGAIISFNKNNTAANIWFSEKNIHHLITDAKYIYFNTRHSFEILEKIYFFENSLDVKSCILEEKIFYKLKDSLNFLNETEFFRYYKSMKLLDSKYGHSKNKRILSELRHIRNTIDLRLPNDYRQVKYIEKKLIDSIEEKEIKALVYLHAISIANNNGKLDESLKYDSILIKNYPESRNDYHKIKMDKVAEANKSIIVIQSSNQAEDIKLWETGKTYYELLVQVGIPERESSIIDMTYPFKYLKKLLKNYPESEYVDDAEFLMLKNKEISSHEGGDTYYNLTAIDEFKKLLKKYPKTDLTPDIYYKICLLYFEYETTYSERQKYCKFALDYAEKIIHEYPSFAKDKNIKKLKDSIKEFIYVQ